MAEKTPSSRKPDSKNKAAHIAIVRKVSGGYVKNSFSKEESAVAEEIFRLLLSDAAHHMRLALATDLKECADVPKDIIQKLVEDDEDIASIILQSSPALTSDDLVDIIHNTTSLMPVESILKRAQLDGDVSHAIAQNMSQDVVNMLLKATHIDIADKSMEVMIKNHAHTPSVIENMMLRGTISIKTVNLILDMVSKNIVKALESKYSMTLPELRKHTAARREMTMIHSLGWPGSEVELKKLAKYLQGAGEMTPLAALCLGKLDMFYMTLARKMNMPSANVRKLVREGGDAGFLQVFDLLGLDDSVKPATRAFINGLLDIEHQGNKAKDKNDELHERIITRLKKADEKDGGLAHTEFFVKLVSHLATKQIRR